MTFIKDCSTVYQLVYSNDNEKNAEIAERAATYIQTNGGIIVKTVPDTETNWKDAICLGGVSHPSAQKIVNWLDPEDGYFAGSFDGIFFLRATDRTGIGLGILALADFLKHSNETVAEWKVTDNLLGKLSHLPKDETYRRAVDLTRELYLTRGRWVDRAILVKHMMKLPDDADELNIVNALRERMGNYSFAVSIGYSDALFQGFVRKMDETDGTKCARLSENGHVWIPAVFAERVLGKTLACDSDGYTDLTAACSDDSGFSCYFDASAELAVVYPSELLSYEISDAVVNGYTNGEYIRQMKRFFQNERMPLGNYEVEKTRTVIDKGAYDGEFLHDYASYPYVTCYSPAIWVSKNADGERVLYAAYERSTIHRHKEVQTYTVLKKSADGGAVWSDVACVADMRWASLTEIDGKIYLIGCGLISKTALITVYDPAKRTVFSVDLGFPIGGRAPCGIAYANDRIYVAFNDGVLSASLRDDLFAAESWKKSNDPNGLIPYETYERICGQKKFMTAKYWFEEGNIIAGKDGKLYAIYRIDASPTNGCAAIFTLSDDGSTLTPVSECEGIIHFPSAQSKFMIKYDEKTGLYLSLTSLPTGIWFCQRNVLGLIASRDLIHWETVEVLLTDREMLSDMVSAYSHSFQYVDFDLDGDDIHLIVREAAGKSCTFHDGTHVTMYTISNYVKLLERAFQSKKREVETV